jgi:quercetin dioxygenase-like cupin family protein
MVKHETVTTVQNLAGGKGEARLYHILDKEAIPFGRMYAKVVLAPGSSVGWHKHSGETEPYYILKGTGTFVDNDESRTEVHAGDICTIEDNQYHSIENNSDEDLEFIGLIYNFPKEA